MSAYDDRLRFLEPWTLLLPEGGGHVIAAVGSGGKSALLARLYRHYRGEGLSVLWTQTVPHPAPLELESVQDGEPDAQLAARFQETGALFVGGEVTATGIPGGVEPQRIEALRQNLQPQVVLVEAHARCETPLRRDGVMPVWPSPVHLVFPVVGLQAVGALWGPRSVAGEGPAPIPEGGEPRRVRSEEALEQLSAPGGLLGQVPEGVPVLPFLAGFGSYRDIDGMFALVSGLWEDPSLRAVLLGELVGEARVDHAEMVHAAESPGGAAHLQGERVYALYPARLDEGE